MLTRVVSTRSNDGSDCIALCLRNAKDDNVDSDPGDRNEDDDDDDDDEDERRMSGL